MTWLYWKRLKRQLAKNSSDWLNSESEEWVYQWLKSQNSILSFGKLGPNFHIDKIMVLALEILTCVFRRVLWRFWPQNNLNHFKFPFSRISRIFSCQEIFLIKKLDPLKMIKKMRLCFYSSSFWKPDILHQLINLLSSSYWKNPTILNSLEISSIRKYQKIIYKENRLKFHSILPMTSNEHKIWIWK